MTDPDLLTGPTTASPLATLRREQYERWHAGDRLPVEAILGREPTGLLGPESAIVLIYGEYLLRRELGESPVLDEYLDRFPQHAHRLQQQDSVHRLLEEDPAGNASRPNWPRVPGFTIVGELGRGGMGVVYEARQHALGRSVALKILRHEATVDPDALVRFRVEAEALARLSDPRIVAVHDFGEHEGLAYLAVERVEGGSMDRWLDGVPWSPRKAAATVESLALAIEQAHRQGVVHRDLKPANILMTADGSPKITDFGLARLLDRDGSATRTGTVLGTPSYMAPEQAAGTRGEAGPAADLYSLGAILYELLTGRPPFRGATVLETLAMAREQDPVPPRRLQPSLARDLETLCLKCLRKEPHHRYPTAGELASALRRYLDGGPITARPLGPGPRILRWCRRRPALATAIVLAATATVAAVGLSVLYGVDRARAARELQKQWARSETMAAGLALDRGQSHAERGETALGLLWMARALEIAPPEAADLRRVIRLNLAGWRPELVPLLGRFPHRGQVRRVAYSPDGRLFVSAGRDGDVQVRDARTLRLVVPLLHHGDWVNHLAFSADGRCLFTSASDGTAHAWDLHSGRPSRPPTAMPRGAWTVAWRRDGSALVTVTDAGEVCLRDARTGDPLGPILPHAARIDAALFLPDDATLMIISRVDKRTVVRFWDPVRGVEVRERLEQTGYVDAAAASHDGATIGTGGRDEVLIWNSDARSSTSVPLARGKWVTSLAFDPGGKIVAIGCDDGTVLLWDLAASRRLGGTLEHPSTVKGLAFRPDGLALVTACNDGSARLWDLTRLGRPTPALLGGVDPIQPVLYPDGRSLLAIDSVTQQASIWAIDASPRLAGIVSTWRRFDLCVPTGDPAGARCIYRGAIRADGRVLATAASDPPVRTAVQAASGSVVRLWEAESGRPIGPPIRFTKPIGGLAFLSDGSLVTACDDSTAQIWDPESGGPIGPPMSHRDRVTTVAISPDSRIIATGSADRTIRLWDVSTGRIIGRPLVQGGTVLAITFRGDGRAILTTSSDRVARQWDLATGAMLGVPIRHRSPSAQAVYSPDGTLIATAGPDGFAQLWEAATGKPVGPPLRHDQFAGGVAFHPGGHLLLTNGWDFAVRAWNVPKPVEEDIGRIVLWSQVLTGMELGLDGSVRELEEDSWQDRRETLERAGGSHLAL